MKDQVASKYDVLIAGGGLAGLALALQLKHSKPGISILVLEKRESLAEIATHKVGESLSEIGAYYLREVVGLKDYLSQHQLRKFGFRFFFSPECSHQLDQRVEVGSRLDNPFPSHQVDRGLLENEMVRKANECGVDILMGATVREIELSEGGHTITFEHHHTSRIAKVNWLVDASGRRGLLKRKLNLEKEIGHNINSSWFRLDVVIDPDDWSEDLEWRSFVAPGRRRLATNHLMGKGYWVWIIPLVDGKTSIGIVADPEFHPFETINSFEKSMLWLEKHEPQAALILGSYIDKQMDFKVMKSFAYDTKQFYSPERWAVTGEAGAFMDPFYSPGSDMIALGNSWITDMIIRDLDGEDIKLRARVFDLAHKELLGGWIHLYRNMYGVFGNTQIMLMKIVWDWASYWAVPAVLSMNNSYTDISFLKKYSSNNAGIGKRFAALNEQMQSLFRSWNEHEVEPCSQHQLNVFDLVTLKRFQTELGVQYDQTTIVSKVETNLAILENIAAQIFRLVSASVNGTPANMPVDPYTMSVNDGRDTLLEKSKSGNALPVDGVIREDIAKMWFIRIKSTENEFA